ncbi:EAL domain-containing protein [Umezawaea sp. Da 62-37]|uniref:putative bifunctional diguanylate cyclase/phosphodiesterase n=1 Tax=Umezawaea sp. Da 62-37 TaxID=3075927 RepID=UPI0028F6E3F3|nr:EAL domain-containing protein [Umezawaea sp. Da 62-37]WNV88423.1 EAL domain-containing protein [Umezawaea sp. Da 62-37]
MTTAHGKVELRGVRRLTSAFAWMGGLAVLGALFGSGVGPLHYPVSVLALLVVATWVVWPDSDSWWVALAEGVIAVSAFVVLPGPQPVIGFLFGVTVRRSMRGGTARFPLKAVPAVLGYLAGFGAAFAFDLHGKPVGLDSIVGSTMPLVGLVIGSMALYLTVRASQIADAAHRTLAAVVHASPVGLVLLDGEGVPRMHNERASTLLDWVEPGPVPCPHGYDITRCVQGCRTAGHEPVEVRVDHSDGTSAVVALHQTPVEQEQTLVAAVDVSSRTLREDVLRTRSERDELTGLAGRAHFLHLVERALPDGGGTVGLLVIDLDQFKEINDTEGHEAGDLYLMTAADRIRAAVGPRATAARIGGDEFAVLAPAHDVKECLALGQRLLDALAEPSSPFGYELVIRASVGVAVSESGAATADLLRDADTAMYVAKREGGARFRLFHPEMGEQVLARQRDKTDLRAAIDDGQLVLHYQPIVDLATSRVTGAEALVRWQRPGHGLLGPMDFIGLAEETGLIVPLGGRVLADACEQAVRWYEQGRTVGVTVNVSTRQLSTSGFLDTLDHVLTDTGLRPSGLTIEVTESVWADEVAMQALMQIRETGVRVALDDFGTGYSSLSYLQRYPFDIVKIDKSFTAELGESGRTAGVVRCIIDLTEVLGANAVAEGIETPAQAEWLRRAGCGFAQGYLFGKPDVAENWDEQPSVVWAAKRT